MTSRRPTRATSPVRKVRTARPLRTTPEDLQRQRVVTMTGPADALEVIPHLFGFNPTESLVLIGLRGSPRRLGPSVRLDLVGPPEGSLDDAGLAAQAVSLVLGQADRTNGGDVDEVLAVVYTDECDDNPLARLPRVELLIEVRQRLSAAGVRLRDGIVVRHGRWISIDCDDPRCCPPEGNPIIREIPSAAGLEVGLELGTPYANRRELEASVAANVPEGVAEDLEAMVSELAGTDLGSRIVQALELQEDVLNELAMGNEIEPAAAVLLAALAQAVHVRDLLVMRLTDEQARSAIQVWGAILVMTPAPFDAQVGAIMAQLAWEAGRGALARCALDRVFATDPQHSLGALIEQALDHGLPAPERTGRRNRRGSTDLAEFLRDAWQD